MSETLAGGPSFTELPDDRSQIGSTVDPAVLLDAVAEGILVFDPETLLIAEANRGVTDLLGRPHDGLVGKSIVELLQHADAERLRSHVDALVAGITDATTLLLEYRRDVGDSIAVEVVLQPIELPGGRLVIVAIARDIRGRLQTQIRLQRLAEAEHARAAELNAVIRAMGEAVVVCASDGTITLANPAGEQIFPGAEARSYGDIVAQLQDPDGRAPGLGSRAGPIQLEAASERERWIEISTYPVTEGSSPNESSGATIVVMRDVTEARRREAVRDTFIGVLSHELRTPLTTIFGGAKLLARETSTLDDETRRGVFNDIHDEAERLQRLVEDVVALNRFGEEVRDMGREPVLLQRLLPRVVQSEDGRWPGVVFQVQIESGLPTVSAEPTYVEQVIRNLLSNAAKYGGIDSTVLVRAERGDREVIVRVLDDGPGIDMDERDRLFELFYRSAKTATAAGGAGIGLFVCARLVAAMGGRIWATRRGASGSEFGFALPELSE